MTTPHVVKKTVVKRKPTLQELDEFIRRCGDLGRRFADGSLDPGLVLDTIQRVQEGWAVVEERPDKLAPQPVIEAPAALIPVRSDIPLAAHKAQPMPTLFCNRAAVIFYGRDGDLDRWFSAYFPECPASTARLVKTPKVMTFRQMAQSATGLATESLPDLSRAIVAQKLDIAPPQWDDAIADSQKGEDILLTNGYTSFAFAKTGKKLKDEKEEEYDEVVVLYTYRRGDGKWVASVRRLDDGNQWGADHRLLLRNSP